MKHVQLYERFIENAGDWLSEADDYSFGDRNDSIKRYQQILKDLGYNLGNTGPTGDGVDGAFGGKTRSAIKAFQSKNGVAPTGTLDRATTSLLSKSVKSKDPKDINSYPKCVREFGKPKEYGPGQWSIKGTGFYDGYYFYANGRYLAPGTRTKGSYTCNAQGKLILDIAKASTNKELLKSGKYKYSPRIDAEVQHIKNRKMDDTPFIIYDPRENLLYLFEKGGKYVTSTSVVDGADTQKTLGDAKAFTSEDWCGVSVNYKTGKTLLTAPYLCTDPDTKKPCDPNYGVLSSLKTRFLPKGIYTISGLSYHEGYVGGSKGSVGNTYSLRPIKLEGTITAAAQKSISAAIHGIPSGLPERLTASKNLETKLRSDLNSGKVPPQYVNDLKAILAANQSFGCIGVPERFINNPKVYQIISKNVSKIKVFAMGEDSENFLVKNDSPETASVAEKFVNNIANSTLKVSATVEGDMLMDFTVLAGSEIDGTYNLTLKDFKGQTLRVSSPVRGKYIGGPIYDDKTGRKIYTSSTFSGINQSNLFTLVRKHGIPFYMT